MRSPRRDSERTPPSPLATGSRDGSYDVNEVDTDGAVTDATNHLLVDNVADDGPGLLVSRADQRERSSTDDDGR